MPDYYSITVRATFGVLADSQAEAERMAKELCPMDDVPSRAVISHDASITLNQADYIKQQAINQD